MGLKTSKRSTTHLKFTALMIIVLIMGASPLLAQDPAEIADLVDQRDYEALKALGPEILPDLAALYEERRQDPTRQHVAWAWYQLGWQSPEAVEALLPDVEADGTPMGLRISAQYALGRVSNDDIVVKTLIRNMRRGNTPRIRDKAACALAYDQIHLSEHQKVQLFRALVASLDDPKPDVRRIAMQALKIHTGQRRGYGFQKPRAKRLEAIERWHRWLREYEEQL